MRESERVASDEVVNSFAVDIISNMDAYADMRADDGEDYNEWSHADAVALWTVVIEELERRRQWSQGKVEDASQAEAHG